MYDLAIIGGGPGGAAAGIYAARKRLNSILITEDIGGQSVVSADIQNWIGTTNISGIEMAEKLEEHLRAYADDVLEIKKDTFVAKIEKGTEGKAFHISLKDGEGLDAKAVIVAAGARRRKLSAEGAEEFDGKGLVYCASCDAPLFKGKDVVVVGGGNAGLETAGQLVEYATKITVLEFGDKFRGDKLTQDRVFSSELVTPITNAEVLRVKGDKFLTGIVYKDRASGDEHELPVEGVFVEIGSVPNTEIMGDLVELDKSGHIVVDHKTNRTSVEGVWAAGDITDQPYKQNSISIGDAVKALEDAYIWLQKQS